MAFRRPTLRLNPAFFLPVSSTAKMLLLPSRKVDPSEKKIPAFEFLPVRISEPASSLDFSFTGTQLEAAFWRASTLPSGTKIISLEAAAPACCAARNRTAIRAMVFILEPPFQTGKIHGTVVIVPVDLLVVVIGTRSSPIALQLDVHVAEQRVNGLGREAARILRQLVLAVGSVGLLGQPAGIAPDGEFIAQAGYETGFYEGELRAGGKALLPVVVIIAGEPEMGRVRVQVALVGEIIGQAEADAQHRAHPPKEAQVIIALGHTEIKRLVGVGPGGGKVIALGIYDLLVLVAYHGHRGEDVHVHEVRQVEAVVEGELVGKGIQGAAARIGRGQLLAVLAGQGLETRVAGIIGVPGELVEPGYGQAQARLALERQAGLVAGEVIKALPPFLILGLPEKLVLDAHARLEGITAFVAPDPFEAEGIIQALLEKRAAAGQFVDLLEAGIHRAGAQEVARAGRLAFSQLGVEDTVAVKG